MAQPVVHFEIIGQDPEQLRGYFGELFGWEFDTSAPVAEAVSEPMNYGFVNGGTTSDGTGIPGGVGGGAGYDRRVLFYVGVPDVEAALQRAESLGGQRQMGPVTAPTGLVVGHFTDPRGSPDRRGRARVAARTPTPAARGAPAGRVTSMSSTAYALPGRL